ncbi:MAG TPA: thioredoxin domain-containing protein [Pyrinomonadaceae bacterium]|jgi:protein-disulfide isomerase|nr:thioredoxin domain-containing protein [Pyrinomonadaceae bacterium]
MKVTILFALIVLVSVCSSVTPGETSSSSEQNPEPAGATAWSVGDPGAPVSVEIFNDYQCPPCATLNQELKRIEAKYEGRVRIIFRNYPLTRTHQNALTAAQAAEAAGLQGKFIEMIELLYAGQQEWAESTNSRQIFKTYARKLKLDGRKFDADVKGQRVSERIGFDVARAKSLNVPGTPTVLLNGKMIDKEMNANIGQLIDEAFKIKP